MFFRIFFRKQKTKLTYISRTQIVSGQRPCDHTVKGYDGWWQKVK